MRMLVTLCVEREATVPLNYGHFLTGVCYEMLEKSDPEYARFLHSQGYSSPEDEAGTIGRAPRRFKGFVFSSLFPQRSDSRDARRGLLRLLPGEMRWQVSSPVEQFLGTFASGLLQSGELRVGAARFPVSGVETLPAPEWKNTMQARCLSPVVASVRGERGTPRYLRPGDEQMSERLRQNAIGKHRALFGSSPQDDSLRVEWDAKYLESRQHEKHPGTKLIAYKESRIVGVVCPFTMTGSVELMSTVYEAGLGEKNAAGFGMVEVAQ